MAFPEYIDLADALLSFVFLNGGEDKEVAASSTYEPLADFFALTDAQRTVQRPDGRAESFWHNRVQWARQRLINQGYMERRRHGWWGLTPAGELRAARIQARFGRLRL
ncbi:MAG TPA: winged helix-turn-helix domain-containing protein [Phycisphaerae bacterium]|nr:winged helix-turn-helix domain-containing protein [Phycisphaerae bacterium]